MQFLSRGNVLDKAKINYRPPERKVPSNHPNLFTALSENTNLVSSLNKDAVKTEDYHEFSLNDRFDHFTDMRNKLEFTNQSRRPQICISYAKYSFHTTFYLKILPVFDFQLVPLYYPSIFHECFAYFVSVFVISRIPMFYIRTFLYFSA